MRQELLVLYRGKQLYFMKDNSIFLGVNSFLTQSQGQRKPIYIKPIYLWLQLQRS